MEGYRVLLTSSNEKCGPNSVVWMLYEGLSSDVKLYYLFSKEVCYEGGEKVSLRTVLNLFHYKHKIRQLHTHLFWADLGGFVLKCFLGKNMIWTSTLHMSLKEDQVDQHGVFFGVLRYVIWMCLLKFADKVVVLNSKMETDYARIFKRTITISNGINIGRIRAIQRNCLFGFEDSKIHVGMITRITPNKGVEGVIKVLSLLNCGKIVFHLAGYGEVNYMQTVIDYGKTELGSNFKFHGRISDPVCLMEALDIFTSNSMYEGVPMNVLEAMSLSKPMLLPDHSPFKELAATGNEVFTYKIGNDCEHLSALKSLLEFVQNGGRRVEYEMQKYSVEYMLHEYKRKVYELE